MGLEYIQGRISPSVSSHVFMRRALTLCYPEGYQVRLRRFGGVKMHNEFTAIMEKDGDWYIAYCPEIQAANGQGSTKEECRSSLAEAISLILEDRREDALRGLPDTAIRETVTV